MIPRDWPKKAAMELLEHADFGLSAQVLQEFYVTDWLNETSMEDSSL